MAKKMGKGLVALSSAAIVSVYGIGYAITQPAAVSMAAGVAPAASTSAFIAGPDEGRRLLDQQGVDGMLVSPSLNMVMTPHFERWTGSR
jgi:hypothetical protein